MILLVAPIVEFEAIGSFVNIVNSILITTFMNVQTVRSAFV